MAQTQYPPVTNSASSYSSVPPTNASSVLADGQLVTSGTISLTVTGTGSPLYLYAGGAPTYFTVSGVGYAVPSQSSVVTTAISGTVSITVSPDFNSSSTWALTSAPGSGTYYSTSAYGVISGSGVFVALGATSSGIYSKDGINWSSSTFNTSASGAAVAYGTVSGNGIFVALAGPNVSSVGAYSTNGITWNSVTLPVSNTWQSITYGVVSGTPTFVGIGNNNTNGIYSNNGITWTASTLPSIYMLNVSFGNGVFVSTNAQQSTSIVYYSYNGITWSSTSLVTGYWLTSAFGNGYFVLMTSSYFSGAATSYAAYSTNGTTWSYFYLPTITSSQYWQGLAYGGGYWIATTSPGWAAYATNPTGTWSMGPVLPSTGSWNSVTYGNGKFISTGGGGSNGNYPLTMAYTTVSLPTTFGIYNGPTTTH